MLMVLRAASRRRRGDEIELEGYVPTGHAVDSCHADGVPVELCDCVDRDVVGPGSGGPVDGDLDLLCAAVRGDVADHPPLVTVRAYGGAAKRDLRALLDVEQCLRLDVLVSSRLVRRERRRVGRRLVVPTTRRSVRQPRSRQRRRQRSPGHRPVRTCAVRCSGCSTESGRPGKCQEAAVARHCPNRSQSTCTSFRPAPGARVNMLRQQRSRKRSVRSPICSP